MGGVYLDYAEAAYRYFGDSNKKNAELDMTALEAVNVVRKRAKVGNMTATGDEFWERYKRNVWWNLLSKDTVSGMYAAGKKQTSISRALPV